MLIGLLGFSSTSFAEEGKWTRKADMPTARDSLSTSVVNGKIYLIGGQNRDGFASTIEEYDPSTDTWTKRGNMPTIRDFFSVSAVKGKIYVIGGNNIKGPGATLSTVEEYDPVTDKWRKRADMPTSRGWLSTSAVNGKIYAMGGMKIEAGFGNNVPTVEEYDPITDKWLKKADMPAAIAGLSTNVVNGKIYVLGGGKIGLVYEYDPLANKWTIKNGLWPTPRYYFSTSAVNGKIYVIGGANWVGDVSVPVSTVEEYDPMTDTWTKNADMPTARSGHSTSVVNGKIYVIGGSNGRAPILTVEEYDPGLAEGVEAKGKLATSWGRMKNR